MHTPNGSRRRRATVLASLIAVVLAAAVLAPTAAGAATAPAPVLHVTATALDFGPQTNGTTSSAQTITIRNAGTATATGVDVATPLRGQFARTTTCPTSLDPGAACTASYTFKPDAPTSFVTTGAITGGGTTISLSLRGAGWDSPGTTDLRVSTSKVDFGYVPVGQTATQNVTITNTSASSITFSSAGGGFPSGSPFGNSTDCGGTATLAAGASCSETLSFRPKTTGLVTGSTAASYTPVGGKSRTYPITVTGIGGTGLRITPTRLDFGDVAVGATSASQKVVFTNTTNAPLTFSTAGGAFPAGTPFTVSTSCGGSSVTLAPGESCDDEFRFKPKATGSVIATSNTGVLVSGGTSVTASVDVSGTGVANASTSTFPVRVTPTRLDFGDVPLGTSSDPQVVTVTNTTGSPVSFDLSVTGLTTELGATNGCTGSPKVLAAGASCNLSYRFFPSAIRGESATSAIKVVPVGKSSRSFKVSSTGKGFLPFRVSPSLIDLGDVDVGTTSGNRPVIITNVSAKSVGLFATGGAVNDPFNVTNSCGAGPLTVAPGAGCAFLYSLTATGTGPFQADTTIGVRANGTFVTGTTNVSITGYGRGAGPVLVASPSAIDFGPVRKGTTPPTRTITLRNRGTTATAALTLSGTVSSTFKLDGTCPSLAAGASCTLTATYTPNGTGTTTLSPTVSGSGQTLPLSIRGTSPAVPNAVDDTRGVSTNTPFTAGVSNGVLSNDSALAGKVVGHTNPAHGALKISVEGAIAYTPAAGYSGADSFTYTVQDAVGQTDTATVNLTVRSPSPSFAKAAYEDFLDRAATAGEVSAAKTAIDGGSKTRRGVVEGLATSKEWVGVIVDRFYQETLGRAGEASGRDFWIRQISNRKRTVAQVAGEFYASSEYFNGFGGGTNATWVEDLYAKLLQRPPSTAERTTWIAETVAKGRPNVANRIFQTLESRQRRVTELYQSLLGRKPDAAGRDYWAGRVLKEGDIALAIELASSNEYLTKAQVRFP